MAKRTAGRSGVDKVVRREICQVITPGTWFAPLRNGIAGDNVPAETSFASSSQTGSSASQPEIETDLGRNRYLLAILEDQGRLEHEKKSMTKFGVALLKAATGEVMVRADESFTTPLCSLVLGYHLPHYPF